MIGALESRKKNRWGGLEWGNSTASISLNPHTPPPTVCPCERRKEHRHKGDPLCTKPSRETLMHKEDFPLSSFPTPYPVLPAAGSHAQPLQTHGLDTTFSEMPQFQVFCHRFIHAGCLLNPTQSFYLGLECEMKLIEK